MVLLRLRILAGALCCFMARHALRGAPFAMHHFREIHVAPVAMRYFVSLSVSPATQCNCMRLHVSRNAYSNFTPLHALRTTEQRSKALCRSAGHSMCLQPLSVSPHRAASLAVTRAAPRAPCHRTPLYSSRCLSMPLGAVSCLSVLLRAMRVAPRAPYHSASLCAALCCSVQLHAVSCAPYLSVRSQPLCATPRRPAPLRALRAAPRRCLALRGALWRYGHSVPLRTAP
jgi:hypothetical protein